MGCGTMELEAPRVNDKREVEGEQRREVERDLFHENSVWVWCGCREMDPAGLQLNDEKSVERDQTRGSPDLGSEEVGSSKSVPVTPKKLCPRRLSSAKRCRLDTMIRQDPLHRVGRDLVAEVGYSSLVSSVAPRRVRLGHAKHQFLDLRRDGWTPRSAARVGPFPRYELSVPSEDRIRSDQSRHFLKQFPAKLLPLGREPTPLLIGKAEASTQLLLQDAVLLLEVVEDSLLLLGSTCPPAARRGRFEATRVCSSQGS